MENKKENIINIIIKIIFKIILFVILLPVWIVWLVIDISENGLDYEKWQTYELFFRNDEML